VSESQEGTPPEQVLQLLEDMARTLVMPPSSLERGANVYREWARARALLPLLLEYQAGYETELHALVQKVGALLVAFSESSNGSATWRTELPAGKAPQFRRALNALIRHIRERTHE
jgi:hypothetical protein